MTLAKIHVLLIFIPHLFLIICSTKLILGQTSHNYGLLNSFQNCTLQITINQQNSILELSSFQSLQASITTNFSPFTLKTHNKIDLQGEIKGWFTKDILQILRWIYTSLVANLRQCDNLTMAQISKECRINAPLFHLTSLFACYLFILVSSPYDDPIRYDYHQRKHSPCFLKLYFVQKLPHEIHHSLLKAFWRNIFYEERSLANLNRISDLILIITDIPFFLEKYAEIPWVFLSSMDYLLDAAETFDFFTPSPMFVLDTVENKLSPVCYHCLDKVYRTINLKNGLVNLPTIFKIWSDLHHNFLQHLVLSIRMPLISEEACYLGNIVTGREIASTCALTVLQGHHNYTLGWTKEGRTVVTIVSEYYHDYLYMDRWSYADMRERNGRHDAINVAGRTDHFGHILVVEISQNFSLTRLAQCFHWQLWLLVASSGIMVSIMLFFLVHFSLRNYANELVSSFLIIFGNLSEQSHPNLLKDTRNQIPLLNTARISMAFWMFIALGFSNYYKSMILSVVVSPVKISEPDDISELVDKSDLAFVSAHYKEFDALLTHIVKVNEEMGLQHPSILKKLYAKFDDFVDEGDIDEEEIERDNWSLMLPLSRLFVNSLMKHVTVKNVTLSPKRFVIFDTKRTLEKFSNFLTAQFPNFRAIWGKSSPKTGGLSMVYKWSCSRLFTFSFIERGVIALYESGHYNMWQTYYHLAQEYRERVAYKETFNCFGSESVSGGICNRPTINQDNIRIDVFLGYVVILLVLCAVSLVIFGVEVTLSFNTGGTLVHI